VRRPFVATPSYKELSMLIEELDRGAVDADVSSLPHPAGEALAEALQAFVAVDTDFPWRGSLTGLDWTRYAF
jgi:hypothetical protein